MSVNYPRPIAEVRVSWVCLSLDATMCVVLHVRRRAGVATSLDLPWSSPSLHRIGLAKLPILAAGAAGTGEPRPKLSSRGRNEFQQSPILPCRKAEIMPRTQVFAECGASKATTEWCHVILVIPRIIPKTVPHVLPNTRSQTKSLVFNP